MICAAYFAAGIIDSVCGGGGLITVPVLMATGVPAHCIAGTNQCSTPVGSIAAICRYLREGKLRIKPGIIAALAAIPGGALGAKLNMFIPEQYLYAIMTALMPVIAVLLLLKKSFGAHDRSDTLSPAATVLYSGLTGLIVGAYQGFYGPGAGMLYMLAFALLVRLELVCASGTAKLATLFAAISSSVTYALSGLVLWQIVIAATVFNTLGSYIGAGLALKKGAGIIRPFVLCVTALLFITLIVKR